MRQTAELIISNQHTVNSESEPTCSTQGKLLPVRHKASEWVQFYTNQAAFKHSPVKPPQQGCDTRLPAAGACQCRAALRLGVTGSDG